jgi:hypothetical protein
VDNLALIITLVFGFATTIVVSIIVPRMATRDRRQEKLADWARQDAVAEKLLASNARVAEETKTTNAKLGVIHTLVNSDKTALMQALLVSLRAQAVFLGKQPQDGDTLVASEELKSQIAVLSTELAGRADQAKAIDQKQLEDAKF